MANGPEKTLCRGGKEAVLERENDILKGKKHTYDVNGDRPYGK